MGSGLYDVGASATRAAHRATTGDTAFKHTDAANAGHAPLLHPELDFRTKKKRESRDFPGKPPATPLSDSKNLRQTKGATPPMRTSIRLSRNY